MDSVLVGSSVHNSSNTNGENLWRTENCANKKYYASSYIPKASQHKREIQKEYNFLRFRQLSLKPLFKSIEGRAIVFSTISSSLLVVEKLSDISPLFFTGVLQAMIPNILMGFYINGSNQLCDVEIDKINKPYHPLAFGEVSFATGATIVAFCAILSFWQGWAIGSWPLIWGLISVFLIWTAYSIPLPLLRWKRYPILAAMVILATWTFICPFAFFFHMQTFVFKRPAVFSRLLIFNTVSMSLFSIAIALFKDIPDIEGDQAFGIRSFSARLGQKKVFWICISILEMACGVGLLAGATSFSLWSKVVTGLGHVLLASVALYRARSVDLKSKASIMSFYLFIWKLLYAEYLLMPLIR